jgi:hypothetical protein
MILDNDWQALSEQATPGITVSNYSHISVKSFHTKDNLDKSQVTDPLVLAAPKPVYFAFWKSGLFVYTTPKLRTSLYPMTDFRSASHLRGGFGRRSVKTTTPTKLVAADDLP